MLIDTFIDRRLIQLDDNNEIEALDNMLDLVESFETQERIKNSNHPSVRKGTQ